MHNLEYKHVFDITVCSARPEEGFREGRNVDSAPMPTYCMRSTIIIQRPKTLDAEEHHEGTEAVRSHNKFVDQQPWRPTTGTAVGSRIVVESFPTQKKWCRR